MAYFIKKSVILWAVVLIIISCYSPSIFAIISKKQNNFQINSLSNDVYDYVIITNENLKNSNFQILLAHKAQYLTTKIVTVEEICNNTDFWVFGKYGDATSESGGNPWVEDGKEVTENYELFNDTQARIRNFIRYACTEWDTKYVLLGGDVEIIPVRGLYIHNAWWWSGTYYTFISTNIRSDLYYAALDGTYNDDFDECFGEDQANSIREEADFYAEVYVGRAPVDNKADVKTFVDKVIDYETREKPKDILLHQSGINQINNPDSTIIPESCEQLIPGTYNIHKLYQIYEKVTIEKWINCFKNPDKSIILHVGSGTEIQYYLDRSIAGDIEFTVYNVNQLDNTFYPVHLSISCNSGDFGAEQECLAEKLLLWPYGGPSACIFNTHYGFATHTNILKYSGEFIVRQFYEIFVSGTKNLGKIMQFSKEYYAPSAVSEKGYRWCIYCINLLGDPETPIFDKRNKLPNYDEVFVDDDYDSSTPGWGEDHFDNIQDGINAVFENGYVYVYNGTYNENINIYKTLNLFGENKSTTIINGGINGNTITIDSDSIVIKNFTIKHNANLAIVDLNGIMITEENNNNEIFNNLITENSDYGVLIVGACHNNIHDNEIISNGIGIGLINPESEVITPCDNIISHNTISMSASVGVYISFACNNHIRNNIFKDNSVEEKIQGINPNAFFINYIGKRNEWNGNYWNGPNILIEPIYGRRGNINDFTNDISQDINIGIPSVEFDLNPMSKSRIIRLPIISAIIARILKIF